MAATYLTQLFKISRLSSEDKLNAIELSYDIGSDFEQAKVLKSMLKKQQLDSPKEWSALLKASKEINSDFEQAGTLKVAIDYLPNNKKIHREFFKVSENINSDFEMRGLFSQFMASKK